MKEIVTLEKYVYTKNVIYQRYSILEKADLDRQNAIFSSFGQLEEVARNTYIFPFDLELWEDMKDIPQSSLLTSNLQEKYKINDKLLLDKYNEYRFFEFGKLLGNELIDLSALNKFHYSNGDGEKTI